MGNKNTKGFYRTFHTNEDNNLINQIMERARYNYLKKMLAKSSGKKILVVGCGSKDEMSIIPNDSEAVGIDIVMEATEKSKKNYPKFKYLVADAMNLPFKNKEFDTVVCSEVIEHVIDQQKALKEIRRVLKNNGKLILTTPNWWSWYGLARKIGEALFKKPFTSDDQPIDNWATWLKLKLKLSENGFARLSLRGFWYFPPFGKGKARIPSLIVLPIIVIFYPLEIILRFVLPWFGHTLVVESETSK